jgi:hypothetical protein
VELCSRRIGADLDQWFVLKKNPKSTKKGNLKHPFPTPLSVRDALLNFVDLRGYVSKKTLEDLA